MGNLCSIVVRGIDRVLRFIFPRYAVMMLEGYNPVSEEQNRSALSNDSSSSSQIIDSFSTPGDRRHFRGEEQEGNEHQIPPDNSECMRSIVSGFFAIQNLQKQARTQHITEKFLDLSGKVIKVPIANGITKNTSERERENCSGSKERSEKIPKGRTVNQKERSKVLDESLSSEDKENDSYLANKSDSVDSADCGKGKYLTESDRNNMKCIENPEYRRRKYGMAPPEELLRDEKELRGNLANCTNEISPDNHTNDENESDMLTSGVVILHEKDRCGNFQSSSKEILPKSVAPDVEVGKKGKLVVRKISLNELFSGSHYAVLNDDENVELSDYSKEIPPLQVEAGICFRKFMHPKQSSGGAVVFQELSDHLSIPNWYKEDPIVYSEIPDGVKAPQSSPAMLLQVDHLPFQRSSSGGGIVSDEAAQKVYLPDLFPSSPGPLTRTYSPLVNTQSSTSFGELQTLTDNTKEIFTDLLKESIAQDTKLASKTP